MEPPHWSTLCLNCGAPLHGHFCSRCGQRALPPHPTTRQLAAEAYAELVGWDGKLVVTIRLLLRRPGELTLALLEGQRAKYVSPVRLYLACSVIYFLIATVAPVPDLGPRPGTSGPSRPTTAGSRSPEEAALRKAFSSGLAGLTPEERTAAEARIAAAPGFLRPIVRAIATDYPGFRRGFDETMPRALFLLIPALAAVLSVFYRRRPYPDHLYFAVHFQAFAFLLFALEAATLFAASWTLFAGAQMLARLWIVAYAVLAQKRVYGGSWLATALRALGVATLYGALWVTISLGVTLWVVRPGV